MAETRTISSQGRPAALACSRTASGPVVWLEADRADAAVPLLQHVAADLAHVLGAPSELSVRARIGGLELVGLLAVAPEDRLQVHVVLLRMVVLTE